VHELRGKVLMDKQKFQAGVFRLIAPPVETKGSMMDPLVVISPRLDAVRSSPCSTLSGTRDFFIRERLHQSEGASRAEQG
jgi:hypothetical protein